MDQADASSTAIDAPPSASQAVAAPEQPVFNSQLIRTAVAPAKTADQPRTLRAFWLLQPGRWWEWSAIWALQNLRFAPIYLLPLLTGHLIDTIDRANPGRTLGAMPLLLLAAVGLCAANVVGDTGARYLLSRISRGLTASLRAALIRRLNRLEFTFHDKERMGEIENKFTLDLNRLEAFQGFLADGVLMNATVVAVMTVIVLATNPLLPIIIFVAVVINLGLARLLWRPLAKAQESFRRSEGNFLHRLKEALLGLRIARAHATEDFVEERVRAEASKVAHSGRSLDFMINLFGSSSWAISTLLSTTVAMLGIALVLVEPRTFHWAGLSLAVKPISIGEMTVLLSYYGIITGAITATINQLPVVTAACDAIRSLGSLYQDEADELPVGGMVLEEVNGAIVLDRVTFAYPGKDGLTIDGLSLEIPAGSSVAFVGPSGGGKSTVASLILGFYHPQSGGIAIDGHALSLIDLRSLRRHVGVVSQEVTLFNDSILRNIAWGDRHPDRARAREAARLANASEFIDKFPDGMDHVLGDRGAGLSGGQRQRLAIARALYRDPRILILDEATSALDPESERLVQQALHQAMHNRTTIIIAHRLSTIRKVDHIVVLGEGKAQEVGTYQELVDRNGLFAKLVSGSIN